MTKKMLARVTLMALVLFITINTGSAAQSAAGDRSPLTLRPSNPLTDQSELLGGIGWFPETVDDSPGMGTHNSLALDSSGFPHISYIDATNEALKYTYQDSGGWHTITVDNSEQIGWGTSLALDADDYPHIIYCAGMPLKYVYQDSSGWHYEDAKDFAIAESPSLALDSAGNPHVVYWGALTGVLMYGYKSGPDWLWDVIHEESGSMTGWYTSLSLNSYDIPYVSFSAGGSPQILMLAYYVGFSSTWVKFAIDDDLGPYSAPNDMVIGSTGTHLCYFETVDDIVPSSRLQYLHYDGDSWSGETVDVSASQLSGDSLMGECAIALDEEGNPHIGYFDAGTFDYAYHDEGGWHPDNIIHREGEDAFGEYNDLAVGRYGGLHASYSRAGSGDALLYASTPVLIGNTSCPWGSHDCNPCVQDVVASFNRLRDHGDVLGFHLDGHPEPGFTAWPIPYSQPWNFEAHKHWQGVQRLMVGNGRYMVVSRDGVEDAGGDEWSGFAVVKMGSRDATGERYRSNRLGWHEDFNDTAPPSNDTIDHTWLISSQITHTGGIQALGNLLVTGIDEGDEHQVRFYDFSNLEAPVRVGQIINRSRGGGATALSQLANGRYLLVVSAISNAGADILDFYISEEPRSFDSFRHIDEWFESELAGGLEAWLDYQSLNLVTENDGDIYLIGTANDGPCFNNWRPFPWPFDYICLSFCLPNGADWADLYRVQWDGAEISLVKASSLHLYCNYRDTTYCNFDAAAGVYVDPHGQLYLYSVEHANNGPDDSIKFMEFRPVPHGTCSTMEDAWVELYNDTQYRDRSLMIDYVDRTLEDYSNYKKVDDFGDKASSARWCLPSGYSYRLYQHDAYRGKQLRLYGFGEMMGIDDLGDWGFEDTTSSSFYWADPPIVAEITPSGGKLIYVFTIHHPASSAGMQTPPEATSLTASAGLTTTVELPAGAVSQTLTLIYTPTLPSASPVPPLGFASRAFEIGVQVGGSTQESFEFSKPVTITIHYNDDDVYGLYEDTLTLNYLSTGGDLKRVLFDEAHGERTTMSWERAMLLEPEHPEWRYFGALAEALADEFVFERNPDAPLTAELLEDYDVLLLSAPEETLDPTEIEAVDQFLASGGGVLVLGDAGLEASVNSLTQSRGITFDPLLLWSPQDEGDFVVNDFEAHAAVEEVAQMRTNWGESLSVKGPAVPLAFTSEEIWQDANLNSQQDLGETTGPFAIAAAYESGRSRLVAVADAPFQDDGFEFRANDALMRSLLRWLTGQWVDAATTCEPASTYTHDMDKDTLAVTICRTGEFALLGERKYSIYLPVLLKNRD